jgi:excisionase family DNA binding protein
VSEDDLGVLDDAPTDIWIRPEPPAPQPVPPRPPPRRASPEDNVLTADEVAEILRVDRKTVYEFAGRGELPCRRLGRRILFSRRALMAWLENARPRRAGREDLSDAGTS